MFVLQRSDLINTPENNAVCHTAVGGRHIFLQFNSVIMLNRSEMLNIFLESEYKQQKKSLTASWGFSCTRASPARPPPRVTTAVELQQRTHKSHAKTLKRSSNDP